MSNIIGNTESLNLIKLSDISSSIYDFENPLYAVYESKFKPILWICFNTCNRSILSTPAKKFIFFCLKFVKNGSSKFDNSYNF